MTVKLHYFNPGHETAVLNASPYYTLPANPLKMQCDLEFLPAWYASPGDFILTENTQSKTFAESLSSNFPNFPRPVIKPDFLNTDLYLSEVKISLWGISPQAIYQFEQLNDSFDLNLIIPEWKEDYRQLCSRKTAQKCLKEITSEIPEFSSEIIPAFFEDIENLELAIQERKGTPLLIKAPYSSSGRGLLWISSGNLDLSSRQILQGMLKKQGEVSLEKALNKKTDFAMLFDCKDDKTVDFKGYSLFQTDEKGSYKGNYICSQSQIESELFNSIDGKLLENVKRILIQFFQENVSLIYQGVICVDMMLYYDKEKIHLHPCVEINFRHSMGWVALHLFENYLDELSSGFFQIDYYRNPAEGFRKHNELRQSRPLKIENGRIVSGYMSLCPVTESTNFIPSITVFRQTMPHKAFTMM